ncbi:TPA: hypothetical protein KRH38_003397 [Clostridioides difficile]|uniref:hypothetical protein n=1 Tax=Clostridioides difficile TaxID=1496 RepID=UPI001C19B22F|nr:hypothetical protein [Clostridioides difficile]
MGIKKILSRFFLENNIFEQKVNGLILSGNTIIQESNIYKNEKIVDEYMKDKLDEIESLFDRQEYEEIEDKINCIYRKKQDRFSEVIERKLLQYNCFLALLTNKKDRLIEYFEELKKYGEETSEFIDVKFNIAIFYKDDKAFRELMVIFARMDINRTDIDCNEAKYLYFSQQYSTLIEKFNNERYLEILEIKSYVAKSLIAKKDFNKAEELLFDIKEKGNKYKADYILCKLNSISICLDEVNENERVLLNECLIEIKELNKKELEFNQFKEISYYNLLVLLFVDEKLALEEINNIPNVFNEDTDFNVLKLNIFNLNDKYEEAEELSKYLLENNTEVDIYITSIINNYLSLGNWSKIIELFQKHSNFLENVEFAFFAYGLSVLNLHGEDVLIKVIDKECKTKGHLIDLLCAKANSKNKEKSEFYLDKIVKNVKNKASILLDVASEYKEMNNIEKALNILKENSVYDIRFFKRYVSIVLSENMDEYYYDILEIYIKFYSDTYNEYIEKCMYSIYLKKELYKGAYFVAKKSFEKSKKIDWANELAKMKLVNKEFDNLKEFADMLNKEKEPLYLITASELYLKLGDTVKARELSYKVAFNINNIDVNFANRIGNVLLEIKKQNVSYFKGNMEEVKLVESDYVVILRTDKNKFLKVCLNKEVFYRIGDVRFDCLHINTNEDLWINLLGSKVGDEIYLNQEKYIIIEIINKYNFLTRLCLEIRCKEKDSNIKRFYIKEKDLKDNKNNVLMVELQKDLDLFYKRIDIYLGKDELMGSFGVPINYLFSDLERINDTIDYLLLCEGLSFKSGIPNYVEKDSKVVLTMVTTLLLSKFNLLDEFMNYYNVYVPKRLVEDIENLLNDMTSNFNKKEISLYLIEGKLKLNEKDSKYKKSELKNFNDIRNSLKKGIIMSKDIYLKKFINLPKNAMCTSDIEAFEISNQEDAFIFIDDKFTSLFYSCHYGKYTSTIAGFINSILFNDFNKYWKIAEQLIKSKYEYFFNYIDLGTLVFNLDVGTRNNIKKFKHVFKIILKNDINGFYSLLLRFICTDITFIHKSYFKYKIKIDIIMDIISNLEK